MNRSASYNVVEAQSPRSSDIARLISKKKTSHALFTWPSDHFVVHILLLVAFYFNCIK